MSGFMDWSGIIRLPDFPGWLFKEEAMRVELRDWKGYTVKKIVSLDGAEHPPAIIVDNGAKKAYVRQESGQYWHQPDIYFLRPE